MCPSSTPAPVTVNRRSPTTSGDPAAKLCGKTSSSAIMSYSHTMSASSSSLYCSSVMPSFVPSRKPSTSTATTVARFEM